LQVRAHEGAVYGHEEASAFGELCYLADIGRLQHLNQSIDLDLWSLENSLIAERSRKNSLDAQKSKLKLELKIWQDDFEKEHGHPPSDAEKAVMKDKFVAYQSVS